MSIEELHKIEGETCYLVRKEGCSAYSERPPSCRDFQCLWLMGAGKDSHRPDRSNVLVYAENSPKLGNVVAITEMIPNGLRNPKAQGMLKELKRAKRNLYIRRKDGTVSLQGSEEFVKKGQEIKDGLDKEKAAKVRLKVIA